jgi:hypothetical protein
MAGVADERCERCAGASRGTAVLVAVGSEAVGVGRRDRLFGEAGRVFGLSGAVGVGAVDRQRLGRSGVQTGDWPTHQADGSALACTAGEPNGDVVLNVPQ